MYPYYERILGKTSGQQAQILLTLSEYCLKNEKDIKSYFQLLKGLDGYFDSLIEYSKEQVKRNLFLSDQSLKEVLQQIQNVIKQKENNALLLTYFIQWSSYGTLADGIAGFVLWICRECRNSR